MAKQVIDVDGQDTVVTEDTAKSNRGLRWALLSLMLFILVSGMLFFLGVFRLAGGNADTSIRNATNTANTTTQPNR